jgi:hypothetical protein
MDYWIDGLMRRRLKPRKCGFEEEEEDEENDVKALGPITLGIPSL